METTSSTFSRVPVESEPTIVVCHSCFTEKAKARLQRFLENLYEEGEIGLPYFHPDKTEFDQGFTLHLSNSYDDAHEDLEKLRVVFK